MDFSKLVESIGYHEEGLYDELKNKTDEPIYFTFVWKTSFNKKNDVETIASILYSYDKKKLENAITKIIENGKKKSVIIRFSNALWEKVEPKIYNCNQHDIEICTKKGLLISMIERIIRAFPYEATEEQKYGLKQREEYKNIVTQLENNKESGIYEENIFQYIDWTFKDIYDRSYNSNIEEQIQYIYMTLLNK